MGRLPRSIKVRATVVRSPMASALLYRIIRYRLGLSKQGMSELIGVHIETYTKREKRRQWIALDELLTLQHVSGLSINDFWELMREVA